MPNIKQQKQKTFLLLNGLFIVAALFVFSLLECVPPPGGEYEPGVPASGEITVRIGVVENTQGVLLTVVNPLQVRDFSNMPLESLVPGDWEVRIKNCNLPEKIFRILVLRTKDELKANDKISELNQQRINAVVEVEGRLIDFKGKILTDNRVFQVFLEKDFATKSAAEEYRRSLPGNSSFQIKESLRGNASGTLIFKNLQNNRQSEFVHPVRLKGSPIILRDVDSGSGFHWQTKENRHYSGVLEIQIDNTGKLTVINELGIEKYLRGVLPAEMPTSFPFEALKAQAVVVRTVVLRKMGISHPDKAFDICDDVHCQVYSGILKENENSDRAVQETEGMVLMKDQQLCNAVYSSMCGGHTEAAHKIWTGTEVDYLGGVLDQELKKYPNLGEFLTKETNVRAWIENTPKSFCNHLNSATKILADGAAKYFRWNVVYSPEELGELIKKKTGEKVGKVLELNPLTRGFSGRITSLQIRGSLKSITVEKELAIRQALSATTLFSSCFVVDKLADGRFKIKGAGLGHGVGMCQYGAAGMALQSKSFIDILYYYFPGTKVNQVYFL